MNKPQWVFAVMPSPKKTKKQFSEIRTSLTATKSQVVHEVKRAYKRKPEGIKKANALARTSVAIEVAKFVKSRLKSKSARSEFLQYCDFQEVPAFKRKFERNPYLIGFALLEEHFRSFLENQTTAHTKNEKEFFEKHLLLDDSTRQNICNVLLISHCCCKNAKEVKRFFADGQLTKSYDLARILLKEHRGSDVSNGVEKLSLDGFGFEKLDRERNKRKYVTRQIRELRLRLSDSVESYVTTQLPIA